MMTNPLDTTAGKKFDGEKVRLDLVPWESVNEVAKVLTFGANKYGDRNWEKGIMVMRLLGACLRHIFAYVSGEDKDPETGLPHIAHATCNLLFILTFSLRGQSELDDRPCVKSTPS